MSAQTREPIAVAEGVVQGTQRAITLTIFEAPRPVDGRPVDSGHPAELLISGTATQEAMHFVGSLRGLGERRALSFSVRVPSMGGRDTWADVFRGKWLQNSEVIEGVFLPLNAASRVGALFAECNRTRNDQVRAKATKDIEAITQQYGRPVNLWPKLGHARFHFVSGAIADLRRAIPQGGRSGPRM